MPEGAEVKARVVEALPNALYRVELEQAPRTRLTAHVAGEAGLLRLLPGEAVLVRLSAFDAGRGRIVGRVSSNVRGEA
jgi:translation initiation factor IF-1